VKARGLDELGALKRALQHAAHEAADNKAREQERAARETRERNLFALSVGEVAPLKTRARAPQTTLRPSPIPRQRLRDEAAVMVEAISDEFDVESLLETDDTLSFRRRDVGPEVVRKLRRGVWAIQAQLDLHGLRRDEARERLAGFLREAHHAGLRCVRVVHGKGHGSPGREPVLKAKVRSWLVQKSEVVAFAQARASDGGNGALMVLLRPTTQSHAHKADRKR